MQITIKTKSGETNYIRNIYNLDRFLRWAWYCADRGESFANAFNSIYKYLNEERHTDPYTQVMGNNYTAISRYANTETLRSLMESYDLADQALYHLKEDDPQHENFKKMKTEAMSNLCALLGIEFFSNTQVALGYLILSFRYQE